MKYLSLKESAYHIIKKKILDLEFEPGSRIREDLLAEEIDMSRTPVREAINQLSAEGFVNNIPRKGIFVIELKPHEIKNLLDIRESLEVLAIDNCIDNIDKKRLSTLNKILAQFEQALNVEEYKKCNELDSLFHLTIAEFAQNKKLTEFLAEIEDFMKIARSLEKKMNPREKNSITLREHQAILQAIENHEKDTAKEAVKTNILRMKENLGI